MMRSATTTARAGATMHQHRVLLYTTCYNVIDGVTLTIRKLEQEILAAGHHVCILTTASGDPANTDLDGTHPNRRVIFLDDSVPIPFLHDPSNPELTYHVGFALSSNVREQLENFEPTIVHITVQDCTGCHLIQYAREKELPIMGTYHSNIPEYMDHYPGLSWLKILIGAYFRHQYNFLQALYVPTPFIQKYLIDAYKMDSVTNLGIWGRGVDIDSFHPHHRSLKYRRSLGIADDCPVICWVGRLVSEKRPDIFANVIRRLAAYGVRFHALIVGAGACEEEFRQLPNTSFVGWMNPAQLGVAYASSDIFLFPSAVETFGNVTLEAASSGLPVVVEAGCSGHLVRQGLNGFACPAGDEDAFFDATLRLVQDAKLRNSCSRASREMALTMEKRSVVRAMLDNYTSVTEQFYKEYGGHHANRDRVYRKPHSFRSGSHPRPFVFALVEYVVVMFFNIIWNMTNVFINMQDYFASFAGLAPRAGPSFSASESIRHAPSSDSSTTSFTSSASSSPARFSPRSSLVIHPIQESFGGETNLFEVSESPVLGFSNIDIGKPSCDVGENQWSRSCSVVSEDDLSLSENSVEEERRMAISLLDRGATAKQSKFLEDLTRFIVNGIELQCRMESRVRHAVGRCCVPTLRHSLKRKNSSMSIEDDDDSNHDSRLHARSPDSCVELSGLQQHRLRRQNLSMVEI